MKAKKLPYIPAAVLCVMLTACETTNPQLYSWYNYEDVTYQYNKKHTDELKQNVLAEYKLLTEKQNGARGKVPPGLYAEYGYMLCKMGRTTEGLRFLQEEINLYPEFKKYISRIIKQLEK